MLSPHHSYLFLGPGLRLPLLLLLLQCFSLGFLPAGGVVPYKFQRVKLHRESRRVMVSFTETQTYETVLQLYGKHGELRTTVW